MIDLNDKVGIFLKISHAHAKAEGMPIEVMLAQGLLMGIAISGQRLVWKVPGKKAPQVAKPSVTWLGDTGEVPLWFNRYCEPVIKRDELMQAAMSNTILKRAKAQPRKARRHQRALGNWIPHTFEGFDTDSLGYLQNPSAFLVRPGWKPTKQHLATGFFGHDRLMLLAGKSDYGKFLGRSESAAQLRSAAANGDGGLRIAINGWCEAKAFTKLQRESLGSEAGFFGWILPSTRPYAMPDEIWVKAKLVGCILIESFNLRFSAPLEPYVPSPAVAEMLSASDDGWEVPGWCEDETIIPLLRRDEGLAWQLAAQLANIHGDLEPGSEQELHQAELAIGLAGWVRGAHARELRLAFPGPADNPVEPTSCRIADQLKLSQMTVRELVRGFHKVGTEEVKAHLGRMRRQGWVKEVGRDRWQLGFPDLPEVSAKLSKFDASDY
jgi:hypothetical protein